MGTAKFFLSLLFGVFAFVMLAEAVFVFGYWFGLISFQTAGPHLESTFWFACTLSGIVLVRWTIRDVTWGTFSAAFLSLSFGCAAAGTHLQTVYAAETMRYYRGTLFFVMAIICLAIFLTAFIKCLKEVLAPPRRIPPEISVDERHLKRPQE